ncbi:MAG: DUF952 domain-containing protein [Pseudomonadota bacterium]
MMIYKIFQVDEWAELDDEGTTLGAPIDLQDGFIHFSTAETVGETLEKHFSGKSNLMLAAVEADQFGSELKWEQSRGGLDFPHLYAPLRRSQVAWIKIIPETAKAPEIEAML